MNLLNVIYSKNTYKKAICKGCSNKLIEGSTILSIVRTQGRFTSVSNYCQKCAEKELQDALNEVLPLAQRIIKIQETLDNDLIMAKKIEGIAKEAMEKYDTTMKKLGNE